MSAPFLYAILSVLGVSLVSLVGAVTLLLGDKLLKSVIFVLVSLATGALLGDAFVHLIPETFAGGVRTDLASLALLGGVLFFFVLEKFLHWRHSHGVDEESEESEREHDHSQKYLGTMVLVGDGIHNFIDGVIISASYMISIEIGFATTLAVLLHEIPQEIGDFGLLLHSGFSRTKALMFNLLSAAVSFAGVAVVFMMDLKAEGFIPLALGFAAGGFIYVAAADLVPEIQKTKEIRKSLIQVLCIGVGIFVMFALL